MRNKKQIIWHQLPNESLFCRDARLNKELHQIFFDSKSCNEICPDSWFEPTHDIICRICGARAEDYCEPEHSTPPFLENLDTMQIVVESGRFAEVREEYYHWLAKDGKPAYECTILLYRKQHDHTRFAEKGYSRQEAFYLTVLKSQGYSIVMEGQ